MRFSSAPRRRAQASTIKAQSTATAGARANLGYPERERLSAVGGGKPNFHRLSARGDDPASHPRSGVARRLALEIVGTGMDDDRSADDAGVTGGDAEGRGGGAQASHAGGVRHQLGKVPRMVLAVTRMTMGLAARVEVTAGTGAIRSAAIAFFVHVEAVGPR